ncbi:hypothetical protein PTL64_15645 [Clostridium perfringens]|nr:hypothetical protein [Clostridium perfringens]
MRNKINSETIKININKLDWTINLISYEGEESPYRILQDKNEILILNKYDYISFHAKYNNDSINIEQKDPNITMSIKNNEITIFNSRI